MSKMKELFTLDFSKITNDEMKVFSYQSLFDTAPWKHLDLSDVKSLSSDIDLEKQAKNAFEQLRSDTYSNINVLDILALLVVENKQYEFITITNTVCYHWWQSVLLPNKQTELRATLLFLLQCHKFSETNFGNAYVIEGLRKQLSNPDMPKWTDDWLEYLVICILGNHYSSLSYRCFEHHLMIDDILKKYKLPIKKDFKENAKNDWWEFYFNASENALNGYQTVIHSYFNKITKTEDAIKQALFIFDHPYFAHKSLEKLEKKTHKFGDIYVWLKKWSNQPDFIKSLDAHHRQILRCWIGAGNYYQLETIVKYIATLNNEKWKESRSISLNRYLFWKSYQQQILDYWLLLPDKYLKLLEKFKDGNFKPIKMGQYDKLFLEPIILLRFEHYYFMQPLVHNATIANLLMFEKTDELDNAVNQPIFQMETLSNAKPCLVHDHSYLWQFDMAMTLAENFNINSPTGHIFRQPTTEQCEDRLSKIEYWYKNLDKTKWDNNVFISYHKRLERHKSNRVSFYNLYNQSLKSEQHDNME